MFSSKRALQRSRMRAPRHQSRTDDIDQCLRMRLDFGEEEVADLASVQEMIALNDNADEEDDDITSVDKRDDGQTSVSDILVCNYTL